MRLEAKKALGKAVWTPFRGDDVRTPYGLTKIKRVLGYDTDRLYWLVLTENDRLIEIDYEVRNIDGTPWTYRNEVPTTLSEWLQ